MVLQSLSLRSAMLPMLLALDKIDPVLGISYSEMPQKDLAVAQFAPNLMNLCSLSLWCLTLRVGNVVQVRSTHTGTWTEGIILQLGSAATAHAH